MRVRAPFRRGAACFVVAVAGLAPCGPRSGGPLPADSALTVTLSTDRASYAPRQPVTLILTVANPGGARVALEFASGQRYDFSIAPVGAGPLWRWSDEQGFIQMLGQETVPAGGRLEFRERYEGRLDAGRYRATGWVTAIDLPLRAEAEFVVD